MGANNERYFQFMLTEAECGLIHLVRDLKDESVDAAARPASRRLQQTINLFPRAGDRSLGRYDIDASDMIPECFKIGAEMQRKLLSDEWNEQAEVDINPDVSDADVDSVLGFQAEQKHTTCYDSDHTDEESATWDSIREDMIPSFVDQVCFVIGKEDVGTEQGEMLARRFPDVLIRHELLDVKEEAAKAAEESGKKEGDCMGKLAGEKIDDVVLEKSMALEDACKVATKNFQHAPKNIIMPPAVLADHGTQTNLSAAAISAVKSRRIRPSAVYTDSGTQVDLPTATFWASPIPREPAATPAPNNESLLQRTSRLKSTYSLTSNTSSHNLKPQLVGICKGIGLQMHHKDFNILLATYRHYRCTLFVEPKVPPHDISLCYEILVNLYIIAVKTDKPILAYRTLLKFQRANFSHPSQRRPSLSIAVTAFKHLPSRSPLCNWLGILFAFFWSPSANDVYEELCEDSVLDRDAFAAFLFEVVRHRRDMGSAPEADVLRKWCSSHNHEAGDKYDNECRKAWSRVGCYLAQAEEQERQEKLDDAHATIEQAGGFVRMLESRDDDYFYERSLNKRRADDVPLSPRASKLSRNNSHSSFHRSRSRGRGWGM